MQLKKVVLAELIEIDEVEEVVPQEVTLEDFRRVIKKTRAKALIVKGQNEAKKLTNREAYLETFLELRRYLSIGQ